MEQQRPLRLGDLLDDYCPRERRVTNHAIVALVGDTIRQTRCTTCESEHVYKGGKAPVRKKKDAKATLYDQVLANVTGEPVPAAPKAVEPEAAEPAPAATPVPKASAPRRAAAPKPAPEPVAVEPVAAAPAAPATAPLAAAPAATDAAPTPPPPEVDEVWSLHRPLIRASLPRNDSQVPTPRAIPEFTMHQRNVRGSQQFRGGGGFHERGNGTGNGNGNRDRSFRADGQGQPGQGRGQGQGPDGGQPGNPNGPRPGGRRRRRHKKPRPQE